MGLFQNLLETYEQCSEAVSRGKRDADGKVNEKKTLLPICHITFKSEICITIDQSGSFVSAVRDSKETTIIIPCTEGSSGRSSTKISSHPLCDHLDYLSGMNDDKINDYLTELGSWKDNIAELNAIHAYVSGRTMINDLLSSGIFKNSEYKTSEDENTGMELDSEKIRKIGVRFIVLIGSCVIKVWESSDLHSAWISHITKNMTYDASCFDYLSGEALGKIAVNHPKNVNSLTGNAKLLSCNDTSGFTFRGRFAQQDDAVIVDYVQSQKMHQTLRWLIANYGYAVDSQVIVAWRIDSNTEVKAKVQDNSYDLVWDMEEIKTDAEILSEAGLQVYANYAEKLRKLLQGYGDINSIKQHFCKICIAVFDAATTGRMGLVFYEELPENKYLEKIADWHSDTSYYLTAWKKVRDENGRDKNIPVHYVGAPSYDDILFAVYGKSRGDKSYDTLKKKTRKQLLECMFGSFEFPRSMVEMAANRASRPMTFTDSNGKFSENDWNRALSITCALARKHQKEEIKLELEEERRDRDYLYGRLLSVANKLERTALYKADKQDTRATNAVRLMSAFQIKPYSTWGQLYTQLIPYINQLKGAGFYQTLIDKINALFKEGDYEDNSPLSPLYLLGYSAQNMALLKSDKDENNLGGTDDDIIAE